MPFDAPGAEPAPRPGTSSRRSATRPSTTRAWCRSAANNLRIRFQYLVQRIAKNGKVPLTVVRAGKTVTVLSSPSRRSFPMLPSPTSPASTRPTLSTARSCSRRRPSNPASATASASSGATAERSRSPLVKRMLDAPAFPGEELVVVPSPFLPHKLVQGYGNPAGERHQDRQRRTPSRTSATSSRCCATTRPGVPDLRRRAARRRDLRVLAQGSRRPRPRSILNDNGIRAQGSADLMKVWSAKPR